MRDTIEQLVKERGQYIYIHQGVEAVDDPFEKNVLTTEIPPLPVKALVVDLTATQANWKMPGIKLSRAKTIYVHRRYRSLLENSQKIEIRNSDKVAEFFEGWRENGQMQIREEGVHLEVNIYSKHT